MLEGNLTNEVKARLFDSLTAYSGLMADGLMALAKQRARALITMHKSGLKPGGRSFGQADFELPRISHAYEILTGAPLDVGALIRAERIELQRQLDHPGQDVVEEGAVAR